MFATYLPGSSGPTLFLEQRSRGRNKTATASVVDRCELGWYFETCRITTGTESDGTRYSTSFTTPTLLSVVNQLSKRKRILYPRKISSPPTLIASSEAPWKLSHMDTVLNLTNSEAVVYWVHVRLLDVRVCVCASVMGPCVF